jgi:multiple sugar transport system permease protein
MVAQGSNHGSRYGLRPLTKRVGLYVTLVLWSLICFFPFYWLIITSLKDENAINNGPFYVPFFDYVPDLAAWRFILLDSNENLRSAFANSLFVSLLATLLSVCCAFLCLYGVTRFATSTRLLKRPDTVLFAAFATRLLPPSTIVLPLWFMANSVGLHDNPVMLIFAYAAVNLPVALWLLRPVVGRKPLEQEEAAWLDGATHFLIVRSVLAPMCVGGLATAALLVFVLCWNEYYIAAFLAVDKSMTLAPWMVGQLSFKEAQIAGDAEEWAHLSAAATLMLIPLVAATGAAQRYIAKAAVWR